MQSYERVEVLVKGTEVEVKPKIPISDNHHKFR